MFCERTAVYEPITFRTCLGDSHHWLGNISANGDPKGSHNREVITVTLPRDLAAVLVLCGMQLRPALSELSSTCHKLSHHQVTPGHSPSRSADTYANGVEVVTDSPCYISCVRVNRSCRTVLRLLYPTRPNGKQKPRDAVATVSRPLDIICIWTPSLVRNVNRGT